MKSRVAVIALCAALALPAMNACGTSSSAPRPSSPSASPTKTADTWSPVTLHDLYGRWEVIQVTNTAAQFPEKWKVNRDANLSFTATEVSGSDTTNGFTGRFKLAADGLHFSRVLGTLVGLLSTAPEVRKELEAAYSDILQSSEPVTAHLQGAHLSLIGGKYMLTLARPMEG